jgi:hypothetical protein
LESQFKEHEYIIGLKDCVDFVQDVYHSTGLSLYFTKAYTKAELFSLNTKVAYKVFERYGSRDSFREKFLQIESQSAEFLADNLNIDVNQIAEDSWRIKLFQNIDSPEYSKKYYTIILDEKDVEVFKDKINQSSENKTHIEAVEFASMLQGISMSDQQIALAKESAKDFFIDAISSQQINNEEPNEMVELLASLPSSSALLANSEHREWLQNILQASDINEEDRDFYTQINPNQNYFRNNFGGVESESTPFDFNNLIAEQMNVIGQTINNEAGFGNEDDQTNCIIC